MEEHADGLDLGEIEAPRMTKETGYHQEARNGSESMGKQIILIQL